MTTLDDRAAGAGAPEPAPPPAPVRAAAPATRLARFDALFDRLSERLNPILVKEARQALKSRQFVVTFSLMLLCCWAWSLAGVAQMTPEIYYAPTGHVLLMGYWWILSFPLIVIVPFIAFRSLAGEREDGTYDLLSITSLSARQIVAGKLTSALLQMLVYLSAVSPCIAFTYLLGGVDIVQIGVLLSYAFAGSIVLSLAALALGAITTVRHWNVFLSLIVIVSLFLLFWGTGFTVTETLTYGMLQADVWEFWYGQFALLTAIVLMSAMLFEAAAARIAFSSENRSTVLRVIMLLQTAAWVGWSGFLYEMDQAPGLLIGLTSGTAVLWAFMGALMTGEQVELSHRVQRQLPHSLLGRVFLSGFYPGPDSGYLFALAGQATVVAVTLPLVLLEHFEPASPAPDYFLLRWSVYNTLILAYLAGYLGIGKLLIAALRRHLYVDLFAGALLHLVLAVAGIAGPLVLQFSLFGFDGGRDYTPLQVTNFFWTLVEAADFDTLIFGGLPSYDPATWLSFVTVWLVGGVAFAANLVAAARMMRYVRQAAPRRVLEDDAAQRGAPEREKSNPWDDDDATRA